MFIGKRYFSIVNPSVKNHIVVQQFSPRTMLSTFPCGLLWYIFNPAARSAEIKKNEDLKASEQIKRKIIELCKH